MTTNSLSSASRHDAPRALVVADAWFRGWGVATLAGLATTGVLLAARAEAWRSVFALSHLAALLALVPLGVVLVATHYVASRRTTRGPFIAAVWLVGTHRLETALTLLAFLGVAITLWQFDGMREVRQASNAVTVAAVVALVGRYLRPR